MKRIVLALFLIWAAPAVGQAPSQPTDWRAIVSDRDRDFVENWERYFELLLDKVQRHDRPQAHDITADQLRALKDASEPLFGLSPRQIGHWPCRKIESVWFSTEILNWFGCRFRREGNNFVLEKRSGTEFFVGRVYPDESVGLVFVGYVWGNLEREGAYGNDPKRDAVGVLRRSGPRSLRLLVVGDYRLTIVDIDMRWRIPD